MKVFLLVWFNVIWMHVALGPLIEPGTRTRPEWGVRGVVIGFVGALLGALLERARHARERGQPLPNEELKPPASSSSLVE